MGRRSLRAKGITLALVWHSALGCFGPVMAQGAGASDDTGKDWSLYLRAGAGAAIPNRLDQNLAYDPDLAFPSPPPDRRVTDVSTSASPAFAVGFRYPAGTRTELEYRYLSPDIAAVVETGGFDVAAGGPFERAVAPSEAFKAHFLMSNAYFEPVRWGRLGVFVGAGVGGGFFRNGLGDRDAAFAYQGRAGFLLDLDERVALQVEYVHLRTREIVFGPDEFDDGGSGAIQARGRPFAMSAANASIVIRF